MNGHRTAFMLLCLTLSTNGSTRPIAADSDSNLASVPHDWMTCPNDPSKEPNAWYIGPYRGYDSNLSGIEAARDIYCADLFKSQHFPNGFVAIFGSASVGEYFEPPKPKNLTPLSLETETKQFNQTYVEIKTFAHMWTSAYGKFYPILTGAGPGLMEAASRGASEAGDSIGYTTYYGKARPGDPNGHSDTPPYFARYQGSVPITTIGLVFSSVSARETAMITHSAAMVFAPGGTGTEWEIFQTLEMVKSKELKSVPIYFIGPREYWNTLIDRIHAMEDGGRLDKGAVNPIFADCAQDLFNKISYGLNLTSIKPQPSVQACKTISTYEQKSLQEFRIH